MVDILNVAEKMLLIQAHMEVPLGHLTHGLAEPENGVQNPAADEGGKGRAQDNADDQKPGQRRQRDIGNVKIADEPGDQAGDGHDDAQLHHHQNRHIQTQGKPAAALLLHRRTTL